MHRRTVRGALAVSVVVALAVAGCGSKDSGSGTASSGGGSSSLQIVPQVQIDTQGKEVPKASAAAAADPAGDGKATCSNVSLAMAGALTGANAALGINILNGAQLAIQKHNTANPNCQVTLKRFDTEGDPQKATQVAPQIVGDASISGLIGPAFSGETKATGQIFSDAGLVSTTASATNPDLTNNGWKTFLRGLANDAVQGPSVANYLTNTLGFKKVCVVDDSSDYGVGLSKAVKEALGGALESGCTGQVKTGDKDFAATVAKVTSTKPDAFFYAGYYAEAAPLAQQLKAQKSSAVFVSADGTNDPQFVSQSGSASKDALLSCPCGPAPDAFKTEYKAAFNQEPGVYSVEAYDLATILLKGVDAGKTSRADLLSFVHSYSGTGLARSYQWNDKGELANALIWVYKVQ